MNFFESQDRVRKNTFQLVLLFILAVVTLIIMTNILLMIVFGFINSEQMLSSGSFFKKMDWQTFSLVSVGVCAVVLIGSLYKIIALSAGGKTVAEAMGGHLIPQNTNDLKQRKLLNVIEEMAIASGTPAPPVYLLVEEQGINAFAAGFTPRDAVIGITQGAIDHLTRDQLQGVIAHEFSHIFNGDMRLNIRLMGVLYGILIIGMAGYYLLRSTSFSRRRFSNNKGAGGIIALAVGLMVIGFSGTFFGELIKAAVSRQREYLADASAVQFTRNPDGIAGALKRIGGLKFGSKIVNPGANEVSHAFFAQGVSGFMQMLSATHPPLVKRIRRIDPHWNGEFDFSDGTDLPQDEEAYSERETIKPKEITKQGVVIAGGVVMADIANAIDEVGNLKQETINHAHSLVMGLPAAINEATHEPYGARSVVYALALDPEQDVRKRQLEFLKKYANPDVFKLMYKLLPEISELDIKYRLPIIDIAIPSLKQLSLNQYQAFKGNIVELIKIAPRVRLMEWSLQRILFNHLDGQFLKQTQKSSRFSHIRQLKKEIELILSVMAYAGHQDRNEGEAAFTVATKNLGLSGLKLVEKTKISLSDLDLSLKKLENLRPLVKPQLLMACAVSIAHDQKISSVEVEILRAFSDILGCPMPPIIASIQGH